MPRANYGGSAASLYRRFRVRALATGLCALQLKVRRFSGGPRGLRDQGGCNIKGRWRSSVDSHSATHIPLQSPDQVRRTKWPAQSQRPLRLSWSSSSPLHPPAHHHPPHGHHRRIHHPVNRRKRCLPTSMAPRWHMLRVWRNIRSVHPNSLFSTRIFTVADPIGSGAARTSDLACALHDP